MPLLLAISVLAAVQEEADQALRSGNAHYARGELDEARSAYASCLSVAPDRTDCTTNLASVLVDLGSPEVGEQLYRRVLSADGAHADAAYNLALLLQDHNTDEGNREAVELYRLALSADPTRWDAWANLAAALSDVGEEPAQAIRAFQRAIVLIEQNSAADEAADEAHRGYLASLYFGLGNALASLSAEQCAALAAAADTLLIGVDPTGEVVVDAHGRAAVCVDNAQNAMRMTLELEPSHVQAEHMLAALLSSGDDATLSKASPAFVSALFDDFAASFDTKLAALRYQVPKLVGEAAAWLVEQRGKPFSAALDAGCGTGLAGPYLRPLVTGPLVGADLAVKMLEKAANLVQDDGARVYDALLSKDLLSLQMADLGRAQGVELIVAADVLVYFGDLAEVLGAFAALASKAGCALIFSCERVAAGTTPQGWRMLPSGRFAHTKEYVTSIASALGFEPTAYREIIPRYEGTKPVDGHLFIFTTPGSL
ncbi:hypothetical protein AB1Y20_007695 [Prymnesium parvum]|uniref:Methyltransferase type 12 domain-containing protein n=1 Tax=Prymnesium parvum TaxID=97485 RepID=A0AB34IVR7_PRYPA